jgi:hypothetical protein
MPAVQSYESHAHHPIHTYVASALWLLAAIAFGGTVAFGWEQRDVAIAGLLATVAVLVSIGRVYTVRLQDRIIMLEMKVRCAEILPAGEDRKLAQLGPKQIVALRFASDAELGELLDRAVRERLPPDAIKKAIKTWRPDLHRT